MLAAHHDRKYVEHRCVDGSWIDDLYKHGILPRQRLRDLWLFDKESIRALASLGRGDGAAALADVLIQILMTAERIFAHSGLLDGASAGPKQDYYLVPDVWSRRLEEPDGRLRQNAQDVLSAYTPCSHAIIGLRADVKGWLLPSFFRKLMCRCATVLENKDNIWSGGRKILGRDAILWTSAEWPGGRSALVLWIERSERTVVEMKIAGRKEGRYMMRELSVELAEILRDVAEDEHIDIKKHGVGAPLPGRNAADELVWIAKSESHDLRHEQRVKEHRHNNKTVYVPLDFFDPSVSLLDAIPNFEDTQSIPRQPEDPEFVLYCRDFGAGRPPAHLGQAGATVRKVLAQSRTTSLLERLRTKWKTLLQRQDVKRLIQVVDLPQYMASGGRASAGADHQLYKCLPNRNMYVRNEDYHREVLVEFCKEVIRMFEALRAKRASITIQSSNTSRRRTSRGVKFTSGGIGSVSQIQSHFKDCLPFAKEFGPPLPSSGSGYPLDAEDWFFLDKSAAHCPMVFHGLDLTDIRDSILRIKADRLQGGTSTGTAKIKLFFSRSDGFRLLGRSQKLGTGAHCGAARKTMETLEMEYKAEFYRWSERSRAWE